MSALEPVADPSSHRRRILLVATRDPRGRLSGRKTVLRTIISSLQTLGHQVHVAHFGPAHAPPSGADPAGVHYVALPRPGSIELGASLLCGFLPGRRTLNEALYGSRGACRQLQWLVQDRSIDIVITDMIRTAWYGELLGLPWIADLDDLLSLRYARLARQSPPSDGLLGYHDGPALRWALRLARPFIGAVLSREASIMARREIQIARGRALVSTVSAAEAMQLAQSAGRPVADTPMAIAGPDCSPPLADRPKELVFLGGFDYMPNRRSVAEFDRDVLPRLERCGIPGLALDVIGAATPAERVGVSERIHFCGYVDDLDAALQLYRAMLVTAVLQGGIKTKIIHAALNGTIVLSHPDALDGMGMEPGREVLAWRTAGELADLIERIRNPDASLAAIVDRARHWAQQRYSPAALAMKWAEHLRRVQDISKFKVYPE